MVFVLLCIISIYSSMVIGQQNQSPSQLEHQVVDAINCGGPEYIDTLGIRYRSDPLEIGTASNYGKMGIFKLIICIQV